VRSQSQDAFDAVENMNVVFGIADGLQDTFENVLSDIELLSRAMVICVDDVRHPTRQVKAAICEFLLTHKEYTWIDKSNAPNNNEAYLVRG
jgi:hypothetical protein